MSRLLQSVAQGLQDIRAGRSGSAVMEADARGTYVGSSYMYATAQDWARFALLLLQDGQWQGQPLLPAGWVARMRAPSAAAPDEYSQALLRTLP